MRISKVSKSSSPSSSVIDKVISDIDLLTLILTCLPVKSLLVFKLVSKQWFSLISDPNFAVTHFRRLDPKTTGLFFERNASTPTEYAYEYFYHFLLLDGSGKYEQRYEGEEEVVTFTDGGDIKIPRIFGNGPEPGDYGSVGEFGVRISQSCNGLLCCNRRTEIFDDDYFPSPCTYKTYIYNPTTRRCRCLPPSPFRDDVPKREDYRIMVCSISLAFDPMKSIDYQVICIWRFQPMLSNYWDEEVDNKYYLEIYSSKTNSWRKLNSTFFGHDMSFSRSGVYWNGCLHWIATGEFVNAESSMYFDVDQELVKPLRASPNANEQSKVMYFGECGGHLYLIEHVNSCCTYYDVLKMKHDYSGWKRLHKLDLQSLITMYPGIDGPFLDLSFFWRTIVFLEEDEKAESLSKLVMVVRGKEVISCDLNEMSVTKIHTFPGLYFFLDAPRGGVWGYLYHYTESLASV